MTECYERAAPPRIFDDKDNFLFMQIDVDYYTATTAELPHYLKLRENEEYAVLRMFGVTEGGNSVCGHIHNFLSYFYCELVGEA